MPIRYRTEIETIRTMLAALGDEVVDNVHRAFHAVGTADADAARQVIRTEQDINKREVELEEACITVMGLHQPVADELRFLVATLKVNHDLERIGDLAVGIAKRVHTLEPADSLAFRERFMMLAEVVGRNVKESIGAFFERDRQQASRIWLGDDTVDARSADLCDDIRQAILQHPPNPRSLFALLAIVQRVERLADHAASIAKNVIYLAMGEIVRHRMREVREQLLGPKPNVLMVCVHNSARSQMAAAWINHLYGDRIRAESAGLQPGTLNPLAVAVMHEVGIDIAGARTRDVFEVARSGHPFSHLVTVCDEASAEKCPPFLGVVEELHWDLPDPSVQQGDDEQKLQKFRETRDELRRRIDRWLAELL